jgi:hypothetical protein
MPKSIEIWQSCSLKRRGQSPVAAGVRETGTCLRRGDSGRFADLRGGLEAEATLERVQGVERMLNGSTFGWIDCLFEEQFPSPRH